MDFALHCMAQVLVQLLAALPWLAASDWRLRKLLTRPLTWLEGLGLAVLLCGLLSVYLTSVGDADSFARWCRVWMSVLHLQLGVDFLVFQFWLMLVGVWPKGGAVALAAFREALRQPLFWLMLAVVAF